MLRPVQPVTLDTQIRPAPRAIADTMTQIHQVHSSALSALPTATAAIVAAPAQFVTQDSTYSTPLPAQLVRLGTTLLVRPARNVPLTALLALTPARAPHATMVTCLTCAIPVILLTTISQAQLQPYAAYAPTHFRTV